MPVTIPYRTSNIVFRRPLPAMPMPAMPMAAPTITGSLASAASAMLGTIRRWIGVSARPVNGAPRGTTWMPHLWVSQPRDPGNASPFVIVMFRSAYAPDGQQYAALYALRNSNSLRMSATKPSAYLPVIDGVAPTFFQLTTTQSIGPRPSSALRRIMGLPREETVMLAPIPAPIAPKPPLVGLFKRFLGANDASNPQPVDGGGGSDSGGGTLQEATPSVFTDAPSTGGGGGGGGGGAAPTTPTTGAGGGPDWTTIGLVGAGVVGAGLVGAAVLRKHGGKIKAHARRAHATVMHHARRLARR